MTDLLCKRCGHTQDLHESRCRAITPGSVLSYPCECRKFKDPKAHSLPEHLMAFVTALFFIVMVLPCLPAFFLILGLWKLRILRLLILGLIAFLLLQHSPLFSKRMPVATEEFLCKISACPKENNPLE